MKVASLPDGGARAKPEYEDVREVAAATGRSMQDIAGLAALAWERG